MIQTLNGAIDTLVCSNSILPESIEAEIDRAKPTIETLQDQRNTLTEEIETLETEHNELEAKDFVDIIELHKQANQL